MIEIISKIKRLISGLWVSGFLPIMMLSIVAIILFSVLRLPDYVNNNRTWNSTDDFDILDWGIIIID